MTRVAILNSRQSKTPIGKDDWLLNTVAAVSHVAKGNGWDIVSSVGLLTWDFVTWLAGPYKVHLDLVVSRATGTSGDEIKAKIIRDLDLNPDQVRWHFIDLPPSAAKTKTWWPKRDRKVLELADLAFPVSTRRHGALENLITSGDFHTKYDRRFETIAYRPVSHQLEIPIIHERMNETVHNWDSGWLIHWTRARHGPWPGETMAQFFTDLMVWPDEYCRSGRRTLLRILEERLIRASSWKIGSNCPMVAFTGLSPTESIPLMRWRSRWTRWAFEPYGIAIHRDWAEPRGIRPVRYVPAEGWDKVPGEDRPFTHSIGKNDPIWPAEREWRSAGDVNLGSIPREAMRIIVRDESEKAVASRLMDSPIFAFMH